jgi:oligopeptidase B
MAPRRDHLIALHGEKWNDEYFWLREKGTPEVLAYVEAENAYTEAMMQSTRGLQEQLYQEALVRILEDDSSAPVRDGEYLYYTRTERGKQHPIYCRKHHSDGAVEQVLIDVNELAARQAYVDIEAFAVSPDGRYLAYTIDVSGFRNFILHVRDLHSGELGPEHRAQVGSLAWSADSRTLFYTTTDHAKRNAHVYRHLCGQNHEHDQVVYEELDEHFEVAISSTRDRQYILLSSISHTGSEVRYIPAARPYQPPTLMAERFPGQEYYVDHRADRFYIRVNDEGPNFRVVTAPVQTPGREHWHEFWPCSDSVMLESIELFRDFFVLEEREHGLPYLRIVRFGSEGEARRIPLPEPTHEVWTEPNPEFGAQTYRFRYSSLTTPETIYEFDVADGALRIVKQMKVLDGYDPTAYVAERLEARSADGARIPISLIYRRDARTAGPAPLLLTGYGAYGVTFKIEFAPERVSLLDRGVIFAIAHVRGGGELGKSWHDAGRMLRKKNTFGDFIAAAEHLIAHGYTASDRLIARGRSAGGLLMGAVVNARPELFRAVVSLVPFVDVINSMLDPHLPLTVGEFEEWGDPQVAEQYGYMKSYSPYDNLRAQSYPAMLVKASYNDAQVMYWEPIKYVARMRALKMDKKPLLLQVNMHGGHLGSSGRYQRLREAMFDFAFMLSQWGLEG